jgi:hypothetical protein
MDTTDRASQPGMARTNSDHQMIAAAKRRALVRLDSGLVTRLVSWGNRRNYSYARFENPDTGNRWTGYKRQVVELVDPDPYDVYVAECRAEQCEPHNRRMWRMLGEPSGPLC